MTCKHLKGRGSILPGTVLLALLTALPHVCWGALAAAVLPGSRSVQVNTQATGFATIVNSGPGPATGCSLQPVTSVPATYSYQTTDSATNALAGTPNTPADIAAGGFQSFVFSFTPTAAFAPTAIVFDFACAGGERAASLPAVNGFTLAAATTAIADIVALVATVQNDGIAHIPAGGGTGFFTVATVNVGATAGVTVTADDGGVGLPAAITVCETNPVTAACLSPPASSVTTQIAANATPTFAAFIAATDRIPADAANNRIHMRFKNASGTTRGLTSVAVEGVGDTSETMVMPAGGTATSPDGKLKLMFPANAVAGETMITIRKLTLETIPAEFGPLPGDVAYEFGPDGLTFAQPVTLELELDGNPVQADTTIGSNLSFLISNGKDQLFVLDGLTTDVDAVSGTLGISGQLSHFSTVLLYSNESGSASLDVDPKTVQKGGSFTAKITLKNAPANYYTDTSVSPVGILDPKEDNLFGVRDYLVTKSLSYTCLEVNPGEVKLVLDLKHSSAFEKRTFGILLPFKTSIKLSAPVKCIAASGDTPGPEWTKIKTITATDNPGGGSTVMVTVGGPIPENIRDEGLDKAHIEIKFLRKGAPFTLGGLGAQQLDFFSSADAWGKCRHLSDRATRFTPKNGDTCSFSGDQITFVWDQPDNCVDKVEFSIRAVGTGGGSGFTEQDLGTCP